MGQIGERRQPQDLYSITWTGVHCSFINEQQQKYAYDNLEGTAWQEQGMHACAEAELWTAHMTVLQQGKAWCKEEGQRRGGRDADQQELVGCRETAGVCRPDPALPGLCRMLCISGGGRTISLLMFFTCWKASITGPSWGPRLMCIAPDSKQCGAVG